MKKSVKISTIIVGTLALVIVIVSLLISPVSKHYIEKNSKELIGRVVTMQKFRFNMYTGTLKVVGFDMKETDEKDSFFKFDTLLVKVKLFDFLKHKVTVKKVHLTHANLNIWQKGSNFNFDDLIKKFASTDTVPSGEESTPWEIGIYDIRLREGNILYQDLIVQSKWDMKDLNLHIPGVYLSGKETDIGFDLLFTDGGRLNSKLKYDIEKSTYNIQLTLEQFSIKGLLPYLQESMRLGSLSGLLDAHIDITGDMQHIMNSTIRGKIALNSFDMRDDRDLLVLAADQIAMDMAEVRIEESKYILNEFSAQGVSTLYIMEKDSSSNFTYLMKESAPPDSTDTPPTGEGVPPAPTTRLAIGNVELKGISVELRDNNLQIPFVYQMKDIAITAKDFDPDKSNRINIQGKLGATGIAKIRWDGNFNDLSNLNMVLDLGSVQLKDFTPYSMEYFAYPFTNGILTFSSQNVITNNMLKGTNGVDVFKCAVDKVHEDMKPKMKVPLRLAVYVMKDRNDKIKMSLPVEGDIRSPKFSYRKIIIAALVNVLVKVSLTPLDFLAGSLGYDPEQLKEIEFAGIQSDFTSDQYDKFNQLAEILLAKPDLMLSIQQDINYTQAIKEQSLADLKQDYYLKNHPGKTAATLEMLDITEISGMKDNDPRLAEYAGSLLGSDSGGDIYAKSITLYQDSVSGQITRLAEKRNKLLTDYMVTRRQIPATSLNIETIPIAPGKAYEGKSVFKANLSLPGETPMVSDTTKQAGSSGQ